MKNILLLSLLFVSTVAQAQTHSWKNFEAAGEVLARHENAMAKVGNKIILIGGRGNKPLNILDLNTNQWTNGAQPPFEIHHLQAVTLDGLLYVVGAFTGGWPNETPLSHILIYDVEQDLWIIGPEIPENRRRGAAGVAVYKDKIYLVNGIINGHTSGWVNWLDEFDPYTGKWKILPNSPVARDHFHAAVIEDKLYVAGGRRSGSVEGKGFAGTVKQTNVYNFETKEWEVLPNIPTPRAGSTVAVLDDNLVILGGESDVQEKAHNEVEMLEIASKKWKDLPPLETGRHGTQAVIFDDHILIGAGSGNRGGGPELTSFEIYSAEENAEFNMNPLQHSQLVSSADHLTFTKNKPTQVISIENKGDDKAIAITYLQTDRPRDFSIETPFQLPLILAPGATMQLEISAKGDFSGKNPASLFIKPAGEKAPLEIDLVME